MPFYPQKHHRRSIRLRDYDYSQAGAYFITVCTGNKECLLGSIENGEITLSEYGMIARDEWMKSAAVRFEIELDEFVVMPNHFHGIVVIHGRGDRPVAPTKHHPGPQPKSIGALVAGFKSTVTKQINQIRNTPGIPVWQRNYYEHIIRNEKALENIRRYIEGNPVLWEYDHENPGRSHEIDRVLAEHYCFTDEELDFIPSALLRTGINYDIKCL
jgi:REP element-mobilizing transposase RayT